jgi:hypothetical protein
MRRNTVLGYLIEPMQSWHPLVGTTVPRCVVQPSLESHDATFEPLP